MVTEVIDKKKLIEWLSEGDVFFTIFSRRIIEHIEAGEFDVKEPPARTQLRTLPVIRIPIRAPIYEYSMVMEE